jgi:hypothetical protein
MNYQQLVDHSKDRSSVMLEIAEKVELNLRRDGKNVRVELSGDPDCPLTRLFVDRNFRNRPTTLQVDVFMRTRILQTGPKLFRPTEAQCLIGRETDLNLTFEDYAQPYPFMILELPENYAESKVIENPREALEWSGCDKLAPLTNRRKPGVVIVHYDPVVKIIITCVNWEDMATNVYYYVFDDMGEDMSKFIEEGNNETEREIRRVALNYCLLVDEYGAKRVGYDNESHANRLARRAAKGRSDMNAKLLKALPVVYEIDQSVKLVKTVARASDLGESSGRCVHPHHRRGHYRMQAHGTGRAQRRRIRVPPVFVNSHLFLGKIGQTEVTYST